MYFTWWQINVWAYIYAVGCLHYEYLVATYVNWELYIHPWLWCQNSLCGIQRVKSSLLLLFIVEFLSLTFKEWERGEGSGVVWYKMTQQGFKSKLPLPSTIVWEQPTIIFKIFKFYTCFIGLCPFGKQRWFAFILHCQTFSGCLICINTIYMEPGFV